MSGIYNFYYAASKISSVDGLIQTCFYAVESLERIIEKPAHKRSSIQANEIAASYFTCAHELNRRAGWWNDITTGEPLARNIGELLMLCVSELTEAHESINIKDDHLPHIEGYTVEHADLLIRLGDLGGSPLVDTAEVIKAVGFIIVDPTCWGLSIGRWRAGGMGIVSPLSHALEAARKNRREVLALNIAKAFLATLDAARWADVLSLQAEGFAYSQVSENDLIAGYRKRELAKPLLEKLEYNQKRQDHKREHRAAEGGKKF